VDMGSTERVELGGSDALSKAHEDVQQAIAAAEASEAGASAGLGDQGAPADTAQPGGDAPDPGSDPGPPATG